MKSNRALRTGLGTLLFVTCMGLFSLGAQEATASPEPKKSSADETRTTPGREMVHASNEAVGREEGAGKDKKEESDEMEQFKHSSSVQAIHRLTGLSVQQSYWASVVLNFAAIAALIIWAGRKFLPGIFRDRTAAIQKAMQEAQKASEEARRKLAEIETRLQKLDVEIGMMRDVAEREGAAEAARLKAATEEDARKIVAGAEQEIEAAGNAARRQLTAHAADLAVGLAQKQIQVDAATDQALVRNFVGQLGSAKGSGKGGN
jgi:F-type H+-transporting ATPase subunit b